MGGPAAADPAGDCRYIIIRDSVNVDVFTDGMTPETLWGPGSDDDIASGGGEQFVDILPVAMENNFKVGKVIIDAILAGEI